VDCNSFYASCEKAFRPDLAKRPVIVLSNNDGCVIAATKDAKAAGLTIGVPYFQARAICKKINAEVFSSNYTLYGDMSRRVMGTLRTFSPRIEVYSIDEAFLHIEDKDPARSMALGDAIAERVKQWVGLPVGVGIAPTKTLAKVANRTAKKRGLRSLALQDPAAIDAVLADMPVTGLWGIHHRLGRRLARLGVESALDLKHLPPAHARKLFGVVMERMIRELHGVPCIDLEEQPPPKQQIMVSRSFGRLVTEYDELEQAFATYAARVGEKLRQQRCFARAVHVWLATNPFRDVDRQYTNAASVPLAPASADSGQLIGCAVQGLKRIYRTGFHFKKAGVLALDIAPEQAELAQSNLFHDLGEREKKAGLMQTFDDINRRYGAGTLVYASQGLGGEAWRMQRKLMSPMYTTRWEDLPRVS
jgi:Nucleotidyltransferase/DNA polymerase involved in DNA repair